MTVEKAKQGMRGLHGQLKKPHQVENVGDVYLQPFAPQ